MKLLIFCIDALCSGDVDFMRKSPSFSYVLERGSLIEEIEPVFPALTYCCHTSILTGTYVGKHEIYHNEILKRGGLLGAPWHNQRSDIKGLTLLDYFTDAGLKTCCISWPVSAGANIDLNMPMIVPYSYHGYEPELWLSDAASPELMQRYFSKHSRYIKGPDRSLDLFTMALALDVLEDYPELDVMLVKMCDLDGKRHSYGVHHEAVDDQLRKHDMELGALLDILKARGELEETNIVILGDHGMTDTKDILLMNQVLEEAGFIETGENNEIRDYKALCHSTGLAAYIELKEPNDLLVKKEVQTFLESLKYDEKIALSLVLDAEAAEREFRIKGPFDFVIESSLPLAFGEQFSDSGIWASQIVGDHKIGLATHGGTPTRKELTTFIACGPAVKPSACVKRASMVDEAPTLAKMLEIEMKAVDGKVVSEILR